MLLLTVVLAVVIGLALGALGGGGSILTVPLLVYVVGQDPSTAVATSIVVVGVTSAVGAVSHARVGNVAWRTALLFGGAGMLGGYPGGRLGASLPGDVLLGAFAVLLLVTSLAMLRPSDGGRRLHGHPSVPRALAHGFVVGAVTGVVGAGGGFMVVPALVVLGGLPMHAAVGSSLVVIAMKSVGGLAGHATATDLDWGLAAAVGAAAVLGSLAGGRIAERLDAETLRHGFAWFVLAVGQAVLLIEAPAALRPWLVPGGVVLTAAVVQWRRGTSTTHDGQCQPDTPDQTSTLQRSSL